MIIVGINAYHADASAAIFVNGELVAAIEEERFTRIKHWGGFPEKAILFCLKEAGIDWKYVDHFAIGRDPSAKKGAKIKYLLRNVKSAAQVFEQRWNNRKKVSSIEEELSCISGLPAEQFKSRIKNVEHHRSHLASAFFASPFEEAACLSIDGSGDFSTTMMGVGRGNSIEVIDSIDYPHSLGIFYSAFTQLLGFPHYGDEYKVMGMAPYGKPTMKDRLLKVIQPETNGRFRLDLGYFNSATPGLVEFEEHVPVVLPLFSSKMEKEFGISRKKDEPLEAHHFDLAASVQAVTEDIIFHLLEDLHKKTGLEKLCIAGGVAQNSVANGKVTSRTRFKELYVPSAGHDAGISIGAALYVQHQELHLKRNTIYSAYTGSSFSNDEIKNWMKGAGIEFEEKTDDDLYEEVVDCIIGGGVVGWFCGRSEFGPRALGGRSIIADPRRADAKDIINSKIKRRESFRPFAPSILKEYVSDYFEKNEFAPFMERVFPVLEAKRSSIPAVTHVDGSGRLQTVDAEISPRYYRLIETFRKKTGVPILLNTSFNENEPIVNSPMEALSCFLRTDMDMLVMENIVLRRKRD